MRKFIPGENDLATTHPEIAAQWHPIKNGDLTPQMVMAGSRKSAWWICKNGHEWETAIKHRLRGRGCPFCSNKRVLSGVNDLASTNPELAAEWHPIKNGDLTPECVTAGSDKKVWWQCTKGHEWQANIYNRNKGDGCPECWSEAQTSFPEQAILYYMKKVTTAESRNTQFGKEMDVWLPDLRVGIEYNGWWHKNRSVQDAEKLRYFSELGIRIITLKEGTENHINGDVVEYIYSSNKSSLNWAISSIFSLLNITPPRIDISADESEIYVQYIASEKENSLGIKFPELAAEWHPIKNGSLLPEQVSWCSDKEVWWQCGKRHEWKARIAARTSKGRNCPICSGQKIMIGYNDLATTKPELAAEWHPTKNGDLTPKDITAGSSRKKVWWLGKCGHEWQAAPGYRSGGIGCPVCAGKVIVAGFNDLASIAPELAAQWHPTKNGYLSPSQISSSSGKKVWWICEKGHEWEASPHYRNHRRKCPVCLREKVVL